MIAYSDESYWAQSRNVVNSGGRAHQEVIVGNLKPWFERFDTVGDTSMEARARKLLLSGHEAACTEPYARWCGRTTVSNPPPTRSKASHSLRKGNN